MTSLFKTYRVVILLFFSVLMLSIIGYWVLGGFRVMEVDVQGPGNIKIAGVDLTLQFPKDSMKQVFEKLRNESIKGQYEGSKLCILTNPEKEPVEQFIGLWIQSEDIDTPTSYEVLNLSYDQAYSIHLTMHPFVRPAKSNVEEKILKNMNRSKDNILKNVFLEVYHPDNSISTYGFFKSL